MNETGDAMRQARFVWGIRSFMLLAIWGIGVAASAEPASFDWAAQPDLYPGIKLAHVSATEPRKMEVYCLRIDTEGPGIRFATTGREDACLDKSLETVRKTTRDFMRESRAKGLNMVAAINADAFKPWPAAWDEDACSDLKGLAVSGGRVVSPAAGTPSFMVFNDGTTTMTLTNAETDLTRVGTAVSGFAFVLQAGVAYQVGSDIHPRTGIGLSQRRRYVYWLVIDGRRRGSEGATTGEVGEWLKSFGAWTGINMDGGGSATLARYDAGVAGDGVVLVNSPVGSGKNWLHVPAAVEDALYSPTERHNGNNIGVYLEPVPETESLPDSHATP